MSTLTLTPAELTRAGTKALDYYVESEKPADQIAVERPWLRKLKSKKQPFGGAKQFILETVRYDYSPNGQWYFGDDTVTYNTKDTVKQVQYPWANFHDGFRLNEDELFQNGITITKETSSPTRNSRRDMQILVDLFRENMETLRLGYDQRYDFELHRDGTQDVKSIAGLDYFIPADPTVGTVGGIDAATAGNEWWRSHAEVGLTAANLLQRMHRVYWNCQRNGGSPDYIMAGDDFVETFREAAKGEIARYTILNVGGQDAQMDPAIHQNGISTGLIFNGIPIIRDPVFADLDDALAPADAWQKRCYMINCNFLKWRPGAGHDMVPRTPSRQHNNYIYYWGLTTKASMTMKRRNCHAHIAIA